VQRRIPIPIPLYDINYIYNALEKEGVKEGQKTQKREKA